MTRALFWCCSSLAVLSLVGCDPIGPDAPDVVTASDGLPDGMMVSRIDMDGDKVPASKDCDDSDAGLGRLIYESSFDKDDGTFSGTDALGDDWVFEDGMLYATDGGQEAMLQGPGTRKGGRIFGGRGWSGKNYAVIAEVSAKGTEPSCGYDCMTVCGDYEPDDCYTDYQAIALGILDVEITGNGKATLSNSGDYDICLEGFAMWDHPGSQSVFVGARTLADKFRIKKGGTLDVYYGSWTTDNKNYSPYKGEPDFWCYQNGTTLKTGNTYSTIGAWVPDTLQQFIVKETDLDGDGVEDKVDWKDSMGVQAQHNIWDYQNAHSVVAVGKLAESTTDGTVKVTLTLQNRGARKATATMTDTIPYGWSLVSSSLKADSESTTDAGTELTWKDDLAACTKDCSVYDELVVTYEIASNLSADQDIVELPAATASWNDGKGDRTSESMQAAAFDYDYDGDGEIRCGTIDRWRAGVLARAYADEDQDEGFSGYRCALAQNAEGECYDPGQFLQIAEFVDAPEDSEYSECEGTCDNPTFDQLARVDYETGANLADGDSATLTFWLYRDQLYCSAQDADGDVFVEASATDDSIRRGTTGLSTLNMYGAYDSIKVCQTLSTPK